MRGEHIPGLARIRLDFMSQILDMLVNRAFVALISRTLGLFKQLSAAKDLAWITRQNRQQVKFADCQLDRLAGDDDSSPGQVYLNIGGCDDVRRGFRLLDPRSTARTRATTSRGEKGLTM